VGAEESEGAKGAKMPMHFGTLGTFGLFGTHASESKSVPPPPVNDRRFVDELCRVLIAGAVASLADRILAAGRPLGVVGVGACTSELLGELLDLDALLQFLFNLG
jgi:hypothetical protein